MALQPALPCFFEGRSRVSRTIGVASGPLVTGTIEGNGQPRYVLLGETLELANKLAGLTRTCRVVMLAAISVRGSAHPVAPYRVWPPP